MSKVSFPFAVGSGRWTDHKTFIDGNGKEWLTEIRVAERYEVPRVTIRRHREKIFHQRIAPPIVRDDPEVRVFSALDGCGELLSMAEFAARYHASGKNRARKGYPTNREYLTAREIGEEFGIDGKSFCAYWKRQPTRRRRDRGPALRSRYRDGVAQKGRGNRPVVEHPREDVEAIRRGEESSTHPRAVRAILKPSEVKQILREALANGPRLSSEMRRLVKERQITKMQLLQALHELKVRRRVVGNRRRQGCYWCLPGQEPQDQLQHRPELQREIAFLRDMLADGQPRPRQEILKRALEQGIAENRLYVARPFLDIVSEREPHGRFRYGTWRLRNASRQSAPAEVPNPANGAAGVDAPDTPKRTDKRKRRRRRGPQTRPASVEVQEFCYVEYRLKQRTRERVFAAVQQQYGKRAPKSEEVVTIYAGRFADKCRIPTVPSAQEIPALLARAERGELRPVKD